MGASGVGRARLAPGSLWSPLYHRRLPSEHSPNAIPRLSPQIEFGGQCHISNRPYTVFRWRPGNDARYKKTIVCQEVAKAKNVCQVTHWNE